MPEGLAARLTVVSFRAEYLPAGETPHCLDFILTAGGVKAESAAVLFVGEALLPGGPGYLSDHVGLRASLFLAPSRPVSPAASKLMHDVQS